MQTDNLDDSIAKVAYILDSLILLRQILKSGDCNVCKGAKGCRYRPKPGEMVRHNCPFYEEENHEDSD